MFNQINNSLLCLVYWKNILSSSKFCLRIKPGYIHKFWFFEFDSIKAESRGNKVSGNKNGQFVNKCCGEIALNLQIITTCDSSCQYDWQVKMFT